MFGCLFKERRYKDTTFLDGIQILSHFYLVFYSICPIFTVRILSRLGIMTENERVSMKSRSDEASRNYGTFSQNNPFIPPEKAVLSSRLHREGYLLGWKKCQAEDGGGVGIDTETVVGAEADEPEDGAVSISDNELTTFLEDGEFAVSEEIAHEFPAFHAERREHVA
jgi:hypothetical protein